MKNGETKTARIDLGLQLLQMAARPGVPLTRYDIAAWCDVTPNAILQIELSAIRKLKRAVFLRKDPILTEILTHLTKGKPCK